MGTYKAAVGFEEAEVSPSSAKCNVLLLNIARV